uniref:Beta-catenin-like protein 1 n=1 Tax=Hirondellea gigas TaxID=1518452 RepID=A0A2P2I082_9CRUS
MDVTELLAYKPQTSMKHALEDDGHIADDVRGSSNRSDRVEVSRKRSRLTGLGGHRSSKSKASMVSQTPPRNRPPPTPPRHLPPPTPPRYVPPPTPPRSYQQHRSKSGGGGRNMPPPVPSRPRDAASNSTTTTTGQHSAAACNGDAQSIEEEEELIVDEGPLDESKLKKLVLNFDKKMLKNQELRIKFPDDPRKFMESELELHDAIEELHSISVAPHLYQMLTPLGLPHSLLALVAHENTDIASAVLDLMQEMTTVDGVDVSDEELDGLESLVDALLDEEVVATLVHNLQRIDEGSSHPVTGGNSLTATATAEAQAVHNTLGIIENLIENRASICNVSGPSGLLAWLLKRLRAKVIFEPNKLYASEILAICVQGSENNRQLLGGMEGIDVLLQQLAVYKRHDPSSGEEQELMENLFDVLCSCLLYPANRELFLKGEGLQLMNLMLREKKLSRNGALRVLDHALTGTEGSDCCNKFVDILGLRTIFPLFIKTPNKHGKRGLNKQEHEGHVLSIVHWLLRNCRTNQKQRLMAKFLENDHEKVDRLMELHFAYLDRVMATDRQLEKMQAKAEEVLDEDGIYLRRLGGGLFTLQLIDYIMLCVCASGPPAIKRRVIKILNLRNASVKTIKNIIREYVSNLGEGDDISDELSEEQNRVLDWLDKFQNI